ASGEPNIALMQTNIAHLRKGMSQPAFCRPGFETGLSGSDAQRRGAYQSIVFDWDRPPRN
ncbi:hypothetical protein, partial [Thiolapillus sp.]|uniref:hypothetical protein n=1 Tax=Thiolapillus sp. TaxID=2017437 RepID=UPI003AF82D0E